MSGKPSRLRYITVTAGISNLYRDYDTATFYDTAR